MAITWKSDDLASPNKMFKERRTPINKRLREFIAGVIASRKQKTNSNEKGDGMGRPGDDARMAKMRARRAPFTDPRDGRLKKKIRWAFWWSGGKPLTTTELVERCYWSVNLQHQRIESWHRTNVSRVADLLAIRIGRAPSQGRPIMWSPRPELMQDRRWVGPKHGRSSRPTE